MPTGVSLEKREGSAVLSVEGRTDLNLLGPTVFEALSQRIDQCCEDSKVRSIVLRGSGERAFSAGVDLHEMKDLAPLEAESFIRTLHTAARKLLTAPVPVVAAVRGPCLGGALELALACDIRIATEDAIFGLPEVRVGLPSVIEASLLPRMVGLGRTRAMLLTGESIDAEEALRIGLIDRLVSNAELDGAVSGTVVSGNEPLCTFDPERDCRQVAGDGGGRGSGVQHQGICPLLRHVASPRGNDRIP